jgi:hypothetical protein
MPHAVEIFTTTIKMIVQNAGDSLACLLTNKCLIGLVQIISMHQTSDTILRQVFPIVNDAIITIGESDFVDELAKVAGKIISAVKVFDPSYWSIIEAMANNPAVDFGSASVIYEQLIFRDEKLAIRGDAIEHICRQICENVAESHLVAIPLLLRVGRELPILPTLVEALKADSEIGVSSLEVSSLFSVLLMTLREELLGQAGDVVRTWIDGHTFPYFVVAVVQCLDLFDEDIQIEALVAAFQAIVCEVADGEEDAGEEEGLDQFAYSPRDCTGSLLPTPRWFVEAEVIRQFAAFVHGLGEVAIVAEFLGRVGDDLEGVLAKLQDMAQRVGQQDR